MKKLEKVILYYSPLLHDSWKGTFFSSDRSSYSDNGLLYIHPWRQPLFQIFTQSINAKCHSKSLKQYQCNWESQENVQCRMANVQWSFGPLLHCSIVPLFHWSIGPLIQLVHWSISLLVHWSIGWMSNVKCQMSNVKCQKSNVKCQISNVICQMSIRLNFCRSVPPELLRSFLSSSYLPFLE